MRECGVRLAQEVAPSLTLPRIAREGIRWREVRGLRSTVCGQNRRGLGRARHSSRKRIVRYARILSS